MLICNVPGPGKGESDDPVPAFRELLVVAGWVVITMEMAGRADSSRGARRMPSPGKLGWEVRVGFWWTKPLSAEFA